MPDTPSFLDVLASIIIGIGTGIGFFLLAATALSGGFENPHKRAERQQKDIKTIKSA